jgi:hypothetical protein
VIYTTKIASLSPRSEKPLNSPPTSGKTIPLDQIMLAPVLKRLANILFRVTLMAYLADKQRILIGRSDPELKQNLDIDL